jgi:hypothetical protein
MRCGHKKGHWAWKSEKCRTTEKHSIPSLLSAGNITGGGIALDFDVTSPASKFRIEKE